MNYGDIKKCDIANGVGVRVSLFVSGCRHHCKGCFNECAWDFNYGKMYTKETEDEVLEALNKSYINGLTILGGEPMEPENQFYVWSLIKRVREELPNKDIWVYTGYLYDQLIDHMNHFPRTAFFTDKILNNIDVLVDGEFVERLKDISLVFRGSSNQRIIDMKRTLVVDTPVLLYK